MKLKKKYIIIGIIATLVFNISIQLFYNELRYGTLTPYDSVKDFLVSFVSNTVPCLVILVLNYLIIFVMWRRRQPNIWIKILADVSLSFCALIAVNLSYVAVARRFNPDVNIDIPGTMLFNIIIFMCVEILYYALGTYEMQRKNDMAKEELLAYKYNLLNAQVNPHFLFNSLNNLLFLIKSDPDGACKFTRNLSGLYRHVLSVRDKSKVPLSEELDFMWKYISILSLRYNNSLSVKISGKENVGKHMILPLVLQMLIENIAKHNEISIANPMEISVDITPDHLTISNPIKLKTNVVSNSFGMNYLCECYRIQGGTMNYCKNNTTFTVTLSYLDQ